MRLRGALPLAVGLGMVLCQLATTSKAPAPSTWRMEKRHVPFGLWEAHDGFSLCNIDRRPRLTHAEFVSEYQGRKPVIYGSASDKGFSACQDAVLPARLQGEFGRVPVLLYDMVGYARVGERLSTLATAMHNYNTLPLNYSSSGDEAAHLFTPYLTDSPLLDACQPDSVAPPPILPAGRAGQDLHLAEGGIGATGTGTPWHWHGEVPGNRVVRGAKRWYIWNSQHGRPGNFTNLLTTPAVWLRDSYWHLNASSRALLLECTVEEGEAIYVPGGLPHQTFNLAPTLFVVYGGRKEAQSRGASRAGEVSKLRAAEGCSRTEQETPEAIIKGCRRAIGHYPLEAEFHYMLGKALWVQGGPAGEAEAALRQAVRANAGFTDAHTLLVGLLFDLERYREAAAAAEAALRLNHNDFHSCTVLARSLQWLSRSTGASLGVGAINEATGTDTAPNTWASGADGSPAVSAAIADCAQRSRRGLRLAEASSTLVAAAHFELLALSTRFPLAVTLSGEERGWLARSADSARWETRLQVFARFVEAPELEQLTEFYEQGVVLASRRTIRRFDLATDAVRRTWFSRRSASEINGKHSDASLAPAESLLSPSQRGWAWHPYRECADVTDGCEACRRAACAWCEGDNKCIFPVEFGCPSIERPPLHPLDQRGCPGIATL